MIKIKKINWLSKAAKEAEVYLSDGDFNILCFSQPFNQDVESDISLPLYTMNAREIYVIDGVEIFSVEKEKGVSDYKFAGRVIIKDKNQVKVGKFIFELDSPIPSDIKDGSYISFICDRVDIY